jgi:hypothetical protein
VSTKRVVVNVDGGSRGNPGPAAVAAVVTDPKGEVLAERSETIGVTTNNVAEYRVTGRSSRSTCDRSWPRRGTRSPISATGRSDT